MGVICNPTNATKPNTPNGSIFLNISGGTPPYTTVWSNGQQGQNITNLLPGFYTATTIDYSWSVSGNNIPDYTAVTVCEVSYEFFDLDMFEDCSNSGNYLYFISQYPSIFTSGKTYTLSGQTGCWTSLGTVTYSSQTYNDYFATITSGPFDDCSSCLPSPTPTVNLPQFLCLSTNGETFEQYTFASGSTINGYPSWVATDQGYTIYFNTSTSAWEVSGWTTGSPSQVGQLVRNSVSTPPVGNWNQLGTSNIWTTITGMCDNQPLSLVLNISDPTCQNQSNGAITLIGSGGYPPYTYSLDGLNYQSSSIFGSQSVGSGTAFIKDSIGQIQSLSYLLVNSSVGQTYVLMLNQSTSTPTTTIGSSQKEMLVNISVSPTLGLNETLNFDMIISDNKTYKSNGDLDPTVNTTIPTTTPNIVTTGGAVVNSLSVSPYVGTSNARTCGGFEYTSGRTGNYNLTINGPGTFSFTITSSVTTAISSISGCALFGSSNNQISLTNINLSTPLCNNINNSVPSVSLFNSKQGLVSNLP